MAFDREGAQRPVAVGQVRVVFITEDGDPTPTGTVHFQLLDENGDELRRPERELWSHLTDAQRNNITTFMANIRQRIVNEVLPTATP